MSDLFMAVNEVAGDRTGDLAYHDADGFIFIVDAFTGDVPERNDDGPLDWLPINRLLGRGEPLPMWPGDRHFLALVFDDDPRPFHGVMPYVDGAPARWSYHR